MVRSDAATVKSQQAQIQQLRDELKYASELVAQQRSEKRALTDTLRAVQLSRQDQEEALRDQKLEAGGDAEKLALQVAALQDALSQQKAVLRAMHDEGKRLVESAAITQQENHRLRHQITTLQDTMRLYDVKLAAETDASAFARNGATASRRLSHQRSPSVDSGLGGPPRSTASSHRKGTAAGDTVETVRLGAANPTVTGQLSHIDTTAKHGFRGYFSPPRLNSIPRSDTESSIPLSGIAEHRPRSPDHQSHNSSVRRPPMVPTNSPRRTSIEARAIPLMPSHALPAYRAPNPVASAALTGGSGPTARKESPRMSPGSRQQRYGPNSVTDR